jgi:hypothetical protein
VITVALPIYYFSAALGCQQVTTQKNAKDCKASSTPTEEYHPCPIDCPNRQTNARKPVLGGGYLFALIVAVILGIQCLDASYQRVRGEEDFLFSTKSPPSAILIAGLTLIGMGLGIEVDKTILASSTKGLIRRLVNYSQVEEN